MKKLLIAMIFSAASVLSIHAANCEAADVWVDHWNAENVDIYVMDETLRNGTSETGRYFKVSTKEVRNGQLQKIINWSFSQYKSDMWRYETSAMDGSHTTVVIPRNGIFEFCMNRLGWSYRIEDYWYY